MEQNTKAPVAKKVLVGNKSTEITIGAAANKLSTAVKGMLSVVDELGKLDAGLLDRTLQITNLDDKIGGLEQDLKNKTAQNKIELQNQFDTDKKAFVDKWLADNGFVCTTEEEIIELKEKLEAATTDVEAAIKKEVSIVTNSMTAKHNSDLKILGLEHEKKEANNLAEISQLKSQNAFLATQVDNWKIMLDKQVAAETARAQYGAINTLNIGGDQRK